MMDKYQVVILAGGRGKRLDSLTKDIPKSMISVNDSPFLENIISMLHAQGFTKFLILAGYLSEILIDYFGDGSELGVTIDYSIERTLLGTAGGLKNAEELLENQI